MDMCLDVLGIQLQCPAEAVQRAIRLADQLVRQAKQVVGVGKGPPLLDDLLEEVNSPVIILELEMLLRAFELLC